MRAGTIDWRARLRDIAALGGATLAGSGAACGSDLPAAYDASASSYRDTSPPPCNANPDPCCADPSSYPCVAEAQCRAAPNADCCVTYGNVMYAGLGFVCAPVEQCLATPTPSCCAKWSSGTNSLEQACANIGADALDGGGDADASSPDGSDAGPSDSGADARTSQDAEAGGD